MIPWDDVFSCLAIWNNITSQWPMQEFLWQRKENVFIDASFSNKFYRFYVDPTMVVSINSKPMSASNIKLSELSQLVQFDKFFSNVEVSNIQLHAFE